MKTKILITISVLVILYTGYKVWNSSLLASIKEDKAGVRVMNHKTGHRFYYAIGRSFKGWPIKCPDNGEMDCYPAETCYRGECGKAKGGNWVVLKQTRGIDEPTYCPVCGSEVVGRNPLPPGTFVDREGHLHYRERQPTPQAPE